MLNPVRVDAVVDLAYGALILLAIVLIATVEFGIGIAFGVGVFSAYVLHVVWKMARFDPDWMTAVAEATIEDTVEETVVDRVEQQVDETVDERMESVQAQVDAVEERVERRPRERQVEERIAESAGDDENGR